MSLALGAFRSGDVTSWLTCADIRVDLATSMFTFASWLPCPCAHAWISEEGATLLTYMTQRIFLVFCLFYHTDGKSKI